MSSYLIMARTQAYAMRITRMLVSHNLYATIIRPPASITHGECAFAVKVAQRQFAEVRAALQRSGLEYGKIYLLSPDGNAEELGVR